MDKGIQIHIKYYQFMKFSEDFSYIIYIKYNYNNLQLP